MSKQTPSTRCDFLSQPVVGGRTVVARSVRAQQAANVDDKDATKAADTRGPCGLFPGRHALAGGWCGAWVKKPA